MFKFYRMIVYCVVVILKSQFAHSVTQAHFPFTGMQVIIALSTNGSIDKGDPDPEQLYAEMLVEPKDSFIGKGKTIQSADRSFTFVCADRGGGLFQCSIVIKKGAGSIINTRQKYAEFKTSGDDAQQIFLKLKSAGQEYKFINSDSRLFITSRPDTFSIKFQDF